MKTGTMQKLKQGMKRIIQATANRCGYQIRRLPSNIAATPAATPMPPPPPAASKEFTRQQVVNMVGQVPYWWHTITLPYGIKTPGHVSEKAELEIAMAIPQNLNGKTVLEIGTWDGYYSFFCEARGAERVIAVDNLQYEHLPQYYSGHPVGIEVAKRILGSKVDYRVIDVYDLDKIQEDADLVLFFGVLYHLENPFLALRKIAAKTKWMLMLETVNYNDDNPVMEFYHTKMMATDQTCWWAQSRSCLELMLKTVGFSKVEIVWDRNGRILVRAEK